MDNNTAPLLYALTPITGSSQFENGSHYYVYYEGHDEYKKLEYLNGWGLKNIFGDFDVFDTHPTHYLRPLPEGTQLLKPGEVAENGNVAEWVKKSEGFILALEVLATICDKAKLTEGSKKALEMVQWIKRLQSASQTNEALSVNVKMKDKTLIGK